MSMTAREEKERPMLPKEPVDLPRPPLELEDHYDDDGTSEDMPHDVKTLLSWHAPGRPFRRRGKEYYLNVLVIMFAILVILFLFSQYMLMLVVVSLVFLSYALGTVQPHDFHYRISTEGITIEDHYFLWQELYDFYFKNEENQEVLKVRTKAYMPGELTIVLGDMHKDHVKSLLLPFLPFRELVKPTFMEKSGDWLSKTFPLEKHQ